MSTKSSLGLYEYVIHKGLHIYLEGLNDKYYIEDTEGKVELPEFIAKRFAVILEDFQKNVKS